MTPREELIESFRNELAAIGETLNTPGVTLAEVAECRERLADNRAKFGMMQVLDENEVEMAFDELASEFDRSRRYKAIAALAVGGLIGVLLGSRS